MLALSQNSPLRDRVAAKLEAYLGSTPEPFEAYADPNVPTVVAVKLLAPDMGGLQALVYVARPAGEDVEDADFTSWPPSPRPPLHANWS